MKICGTTNEEDALLAVAMGADAVGFVLAASPRQIAPGRVADIVKRLPSDVLTVGVFRNQSPERVVDLVHATGVKGAQLHGQESASDSTFVRDRVRLVIKAFAAGDPALASAAGYGADLILLDGASPGTGQVFDWRLAEGVPPGQRLLLAGGLTTDNVADAIAQVQPWGVDVVTGVEAAPGKKDPRKLRAFVAAAKAASRPGYQASGEGPYDWDDG